MSSFIRASMLVLLGAFGLSACDDDCQAPPGTFEPIPGCAVTLAEGEDLFAFCTNPPVGEPCGGPDDPLAQEWLASLQEHQVVDGDAYPRPLRVGCGPVDADEIPVGDGELFEGRCCWVMVMLENSREGNCVNATL